MERQQNGNVWHSFNCLFPWTSEKGDSDCHSLDGFCLNVISSNLTILYPISFGSSKMVLEQSILFHPRLLAVYTSFPLNMQHYEGEISDLELYFVIVNNEYGEQTEEELLPGGKNVRVTNENVITFIHLVANHRLNSQVLVALPLS